MKPALLLLNYHNPEQSGGFTNFPQVSDTIEGLILSFKEDKLPILSVHDSFSNGYDIPPAELNTDKLLENEPQFWKNGLNCFSEKSITTYIRENKIDELLVCGFSTEKSMAATIHGGLMKMPELSITIPEDGHSTRHNKTMTASRMIERYNLWWKLASDSYENLSVSSGEYLMERF